MVAAFVDRMREAFGSEDVDLQIRRGIAGNDTFWAKENGIEVGSRPWHGEESKK